MTEIEIIKADITALNVDAIVNAANNALLGGGGVDGAIHRAAGRELYEYCKKLNGCPTGEAVITPGFKLKAKYVIHTVGPIWYGGKSNEDELLRECYNNSLKLALKNEIKTIAFPNISTGIYGYPKEKAAKIALECINEFVKNNYLLSKIIFVCYDNENFDIYNSIFGNK